MTITTAYRAHRHLWDFQDSEPINDAIEFLGRHDDGRYG